MPIGDIQAIKAKAKQGKTYLASIFVSAILGGKCVNVESRQQKAKVLFFDTEQHERNTAKVVKRIQYLCGNSTKRNNPLLRAFSLRTMTAGQRFSSIEKTIQEWRPAVVFVDGVRDLLNDFNDIEQSATLINELMKLSKDCNCAIVCVLHTNKGKDDNNMRGHLGTELLNKCSDVWEVQKNGDVFNVEETDCRNEPTGNWAFELDEKGIPIESAITNPLSKDEKKIFRISGIFENILSGGKALRHTDLTKEYAERAGVTSGQAKKDIAFALEKEILSKGDDTNYRLNSI